MIDTRRTFVAVRLRCPNGHEEFNTLEAFEAARGERGNVGLICTRCSHSLAEVSRALLPDRSR